MVSQNSKVTKDLASIIFNTFWHMIVTFVACMHPKFSAHVPMNSSPDLLGYFGAFADDVIYSFINLTAHSTFTVLCFIDFGFDEVRSIGFLLSC